MCMPFNPHYSLGQIVTLAIHEQFQYGNIIQKHGVIHTHQQILLVQPSR